VGIISARSEGHVPVRRGVGLSISTMVIATSTTSTTTMYVRCVSENHQSHYLPGASVCFYFICVGQDGILPYKLSVGYINPLGKNKDTLPKVQNLRKGVITICQKLFLHLVEF